MDGQTSVLGQMRVESKMLARFIGVRTWDSQSISFKEVVFNKR